MGCNSTGEEYDAVVIGSGYGGSVAACRMSMAGLNVCLVEKGRRWNAEDFPTNSFAMLSAIRLQYRKLRFGSKTALYQVHIEDDSLTAMGCGLGGGSLINAGVMIPATVRAKRDPKWPKEWERDWKLCESSASLMLRIQSVPVIKFQSEKIMEELTASIEDLNMKSQGPLNLSINFDDDNVDDQDVQVSAGNKKQKMNYCLACGNCFGGCPYNAKYSTDKTYLPSAVKAGCVIKTECEVQYLVRNSDDLLEEDKTLCKRKRWRIYFDEFNYITSDFVVLSAGVYGTAKILSKSQKRGLLLSDKFGSGLSCNGNAVAYVSGSKAPINSYAIDKKRLSSISLENRPGPSISSSFTSSLGFTIQSAVLPLAYPCLLFKGIATLSWPFGYSFLHGIRDTLKQLLKKEPCNDVVLNAMGYDDSNGKISFNRDSLFFQTPNDPLLPRKIEAFQKLAKKLGGILFMPRVRTTSVHLLGGCNASSDFVSGVCNHAGQVFDKKTQTSVHDGLYVCDASLIPCSVGVNPCLTITTAAEHACKHLVKDILNYKIKCDHENFELKSSSSKPERSKKQCRLVLFEETMTGHVGGMPCKLYLKLKIDSLETLKGKVAGLVICRGLEKEGIHIIDGDVNMCLVDNRTPYTQYVHYRLLLAASSGSRYLLEGKKVLNPFFLALQAWKESTTLHLVLKTINTKETLGDAIINLKGEVHISGMGLIKCLVNMKGERRLKYLSLFLQNIFTTYFLQIPRGFLKEFSPLEPYQKGYPESTLHELKTEDGITIICQRWKSTQRRHEDVERPYPILLINGYATECYYLPTEPNDLIRTLLNEGYETWLLQSRLHPSSRLSMSSRYTTIQDIGRYDIPSAIHKIFGFHESDIKVHIVGHCVGGLASHIALMGGHVSCNKIASLTCTNSSMFFKLDAFSMLKMWLPLVPMSMIILGKDTNLPLFTTMKANSRQKLLKAIARRIPRSERCTSEECEVFSGVFGNTFLHENISLSLHHWMNKEYLPSLPLSAFPHLRKICNAGHIVDGEGNNSYLIHPERLAVSTLYISGGRPVLVTPETSFLANKYMKLHHPGLRHERVVINGFGHMDLLMGEKSDTVVFPHILRHISLAETGRKFSGNDLNERRLLPKDALSWADDSYHSGDKGGSFYAILLTSFFFICFYFLSLSSKIFN